MIELMKIEFDRLKRKLIITVGLCVLFAVSIFFIQFEHVNDLFPKERIQQIEQAMNSYHIVLNRINKLKDTSQTTQDYRIFLEQQLSDLSMLKIYYKDEQKMEERNELEGIIDMQLYHSLEEGMSFDRMILRDNKEDVEQRVLLYQTYQEKGMKQKQWETTPTLMYTLSCALDGFTPFMIGLCIILILFSCTIWAEDFEYRIHYFLYTSPYRKEHIYWARCIVYLGSIILLLIISLCSLCLPAFILHGIGTNEFVTTTRDFVSLHLMAPELNAVIPIIYKVASEGILLLLYMFCFFAFIQLLSILVKGKMESIMYILTIFMLNIFLFQYMAQDFLLLSQFGITTMHFTLIFKCILMTLCGVIFLKMSEFIFLRYDG